MKLPVLSDQPATYVHRVGQEFKHLPEVYQIELTNACNLKCPMCLRTTDMLRPDQMLDLRLLEIMHERGDFDGSYYVELQMAGEPTMHPQLQEAVTFLKRRVGVMVGLSTHGLLMQKAGVIPALLDLDALTISVDSVDPEVYAKMRYPARIEKLWTNLRLFFEAMRARQREAPVPFVELQLVATSLVEGSGNVAALEAVVEREGWPCSVRVTGDCFGEMQSTRAASYRQRNTDLCLNPFSSISVAQNGDVVSCCFIFDPKRDEANWYGNLYDNSLAEVWASERVREMQRKHIDGASPDQCAKCYLRSPVQIHLNIISRLVRRQRSASL